MESSRDHAEDFEGPSVERHRPARDRRGTAESRPPHALAQEHDVRTAIVGLERPPQKWTDAERAEVVHRDDSRGDLDRERLTRHRHGRVPLGDDVGEDGVSLADVFEVQPRDAALARVDPHERFGTRDRQWLQKERVDDRKQRDVAADGQRERDDGGPGEPFVSANQAEPVRHILLKLRRKSRQATLAVDATVQLDERVACAADVAELAQGLFPRRGRIEALRLEVTRAHLQMKPHLVPHVVTHFAYGLRGKPEQSSNA